jgi:hypothetical protein
MANSKTDMAQKGRKKQTLVQSWRLYGVISGGGPYRETGGARRAATRGTAGGTAAGTDTGVGIPGRRAVGAARAAGYAWYPGMLV